MYNSQTRLRELLTASQLGAIPLSDEELLALVLDDHIPMREAALQMIRVCGLSGIAQELSSSPESLARFGLFPQHIQRLKMAYELISRCNLAARLTQTQITCPDDAARLFRTQMMHLDHEELHLLVLNTQYRIVEYKKVYQGTVDCSILRVAEVLRPAIVRNCPAILLAHNHPSGNSQASFEDEEVTSRLRQAGNLLDIEIVDHLIIGHPGYMSMQQKMQWPGSFTRYMHN